MSTWIQDIEKKNPKLAGAYKITGNQDSRSLKNMVRALELMPALNTAEDNKRLAATKIILKARSWE